MEIREITGGVMVTTGNTMNDDFNGNDLSDTAKLLWRTYKAIYLGVPELAQIFKYSSKASVHNALSNGRLKDLKTKRSGGRILVDIRDLADFLDGNENLKQED